MNKLLSIKNLYKNYNNQKESVNAVDNISFDVYENDFISLIGPSGCGKSTILSIIGKLDNKSYGEILYKDNITISYMFQEDALFPWKTVLENCVLPLKINNSINEENKNYVINLLKKYELYDFINSYPNELSGGMRQRAAFLRTALCNSEMMLLDEPFGALDIITRNEMQDWLLKLRSKLNQSILLVTHDIDEALYLADRIIILSGTPAIVSKTISLKDVDKSRDWLFSQSEIKKELYELLGKKSNA